MPATREITTVLATLVRGTKSVQCQWWLRNDVRQHQLKRVYVTPISASDTADAGPDISVNNADSDDVCIDYGLIHRHKVSLTSERSQMLDDAFEYLYTTISRRTTLKNDTEQSHESCADAPVCVFLLPDEDGFVTRSDFLEYRLLGCPQVVSSSSFLTPLGKICRFLGFIDAWQDVARALEAAVGVVLLKTGSSVISASPAPKDLSLESPISRVERELEQRLSFDWLQSTAIRQYRVCLVIGPQIVRSWLSRWQAAAALGVRLVLLTTGDWWPNEQGEKDSLAHLREACVTIELSSGQDEEGLGLSDRIVRAIREYPQPVDGIFTSSDDYLVSVAQACEVLNLNTSGSKPFIISTDKFYTRMFSGRDIGSTFAVKSIGELENQIGTGGDMGGRLQYPVVCKPSTGRGSEGVFRADNADELLDVVSRILAIRDCPNGVVVEDYVDGPEIDANLVLHDGRLLFAEVVDDFPCSADTASSSRGGTFNETQTHTPSGLPKDEQSAVIEEMTKAVLLQGFRSGVFHCEARVRNSCMDYVVDPAVPFPILQRASPSAGGKRGELSVFLHEINARAPGMGSSTASLFSSGVDYFALQVLCAIRDWSRFEALAAPLLHSPANYVSLANVAVDVSLAQMRALGVPGVASFARNDGPMPNARIAIDGEAYPVAELRRTRPDIMDHLPYHVTIARPSDWYGGHQGSWRWFTTGVVVSPLSREHALTMVEEFSKIFEELLQEAPERVAAPENP